MRFQVFICLFLLTSFGGCASVNNYLGMDIREYNRAVKDNRILSVVRSVDAGGIDEEFVRVMKAKGYERIHYSDPQMGIIVFVKNPPLYSYLTGGTDSRRLLVRSVAIDEKYHRIEFCPVPYSLVFRKGIQQDIVEIVEALSNEFE